MKTRVCEGSCSSTIFDFGTRRRWLVRFAPGRSTPGYRDPRYQLDRSLREPQSQSGHCGGEKNSSPYRKSIRGLPARSSLLYWLSYPDLCLAYNISNSNARNMDAVLLVDEGHWRPTPLGATFPLYVDITVTGRNWINRFSVEGNNREREGRTTLSRRQKIQNMQKEIWCFWMSESVAPYVRICSSTK
jgi:hypothetical protein